MRRVVVALIFKFDVEIPIIQKSPNLYCVVVSSYHIHEHFQPKLVLSSFVSGSLRLLFFFFSASLPSLDSPPIHLSPLFPNNCELLVCRAVFFFISFSLVIPFPLCGHLRGSISLRCWTNY